MQHSAEAKLRFFNLGTALAAFKSVRQRFTSTITKTPQKKLAQRIATVRTRPRTRGAMRLGVRPQLRWRAREVPYEHVNPVFMLCMFVFKLTSWRGIKAPCAPGLVPSITHPDSTFMLACTDHSLCVCVCVCVCVFVTEIKTI